MINHRLSLIPHIYYSMNDSLKSRYRSRVLFLKEFHRLQINEAGLDLKSVASSAISLATKKQAEEAEKGAKKLAKLRDIAKQAKATEFEKSLQLACNDIDKFVGGGAAIFQKGIAALQASMSKGKLSSGEENGLLKSTKFLTILENGFEKLKGELEKLQGEINDKTEEKDEKEKVNSILANLGFTSFPGGGGSLAILKKEAGEDEEKKENLEIISDLIKVMDESFASPNSGFFQSVIMKALTGIPYLKEGGEEEFFISLLSVSIESLLAMQAAASAGRFDMRSLFNDKTPRTVAIKKGETIKAADDFAAAVMRYAGLQAGKSEDEVSKIFNDSKKPEKDKAVAAFLQKVAEESKQDEMTVHLVVSNLMNAGMLKVNESKFFRQVFVTGKSLSKQISFLLQEEGNSQSPQGNTNKKSADDKDDKKSEKHADDKDPFSKLANMIIKNSKELTEAKPEDIISILKIIPSAFLNVH